MFIYVYLIDLIPDNNWFDVGFDRGWYRMVAEGGLESTPPGTHSTDKMAGTERVKKGGASAENVDSVELFSYSFCSFGIMQSSA